MNRIKEFVKDNLIMILIVIFMGLVYVYGMYTNKPWYDELYTYYYFVSRGPVYAGIHWPVPNNHMGYSVLAACFNIVFDQYIGLRGVAVLSSIANIILVYRIAYRLLGRKTYGYLASVVFSGTYLVHSLAIQGRGYALTTLCLNVAICCIISIVFKDYEKSKRKIAKYRPYIIFALALPLGLYTIPSSLYWVLPVCLFGGFVLMMQKRYKEMWTLIIFSVGAAIITLGLYSIVWLAIGSNLLSKEASSAWFGVYQVNIITHAPFAALKTGMDYMLATPYIQSTDRSIVITGMWRYFGELFDLYVSSSGYIITLIIILAAIMAAIRLWKLRDKPVEQSADYMAGALLLIFTVVLPVMLIVQSVQPYKRVFSYFGVIWAFALTYVIKKCITLISDTKKQEIIFAAIGVVITVLLLIQTYRVSVPLADRENDIAQVLDECKGTDGFEPENIDSIYYTDDFQKFVIKFYYDTEPVETTLEEANYVLVSSDLTRADGMREWPMLTNSDDFKIDYVKENFVLIGGTDKYMLYRRNAR